MTMGGTMLRAWSTSPGVLAICGGRPSIMLCSREGYGTRPPVNGQRLGFDFGFSYAHRRAAAEGMIGRSGLGKFRYLEFGYLWLQDLAAAGRI